MRRSDLAGGGLSRNGGGVPRQLRRWPNLPASQIARRRRDEPFPDLASGVELHRRSARVSSIAQNLPHLGLGRRLETEPFAIIRIMREQFAPERQRALGVISCEFEFPEPLKNGGKPVVRKGRSTFQSGASGSSL